MYTNADTLTNKMRELQILAIERKADIIMITEVRPKHTKEILSKQQFMLEGYDLYTNIEEEEEARGVAVYIAKHLALRAHEIEIDSDFNESIWVQLNISESTKIKLGCVYRSPTSLPVNDDKLHKLLAESNSRGSSQIIVMGDFNHPEIDWNTKTTEKGMYHRSQLFLDAVRDAYLIQHIDTPTRFRHGQNPHILDLLLTNEDNMIRNVEYHAGLGLSDHVVITCNLQVNSQKQKKAEPRFRYHKGDYQKMNQNLVEIDWESNLNSLTAEDAWKFSPLC